MNGMGLDRGVGGDDKTQALITVIIGVAILGYVYWAQFIDGLAPCPLCWWQRYAWFAAVALACVSLILSLRWAVCWSARWGARLARWALLGTAAALAIGACIAGYHVGIEAGWWQGNMACAAPEIGADASIEELRAALMQLDIVSCKEVVWTWLGWSMAAWNVVVSFLLSSWIVAGIMLRKS